VKDEGEVKSFCLTRFGKKKEGGDRWKVKDGRKRVRSQDEKTRGSGEGPGQRVRKGL